MGKLRWAAVGALLALSVVVDFASKFMSIAADGVLIAVAVAVALPLLKKSK